uniref:SAWADEE domain-containing protein n=1 Tax=Aegilops tauschii subsp. strangulata TaxID=200361 RepID=A0A453RH51_AEGTS
PDSLIFRQLYNAHIPLVFNHSPQWVYYLCVMPTVLALINFFVFQEVKVRFSGFGPEEDEWINVRKCVRLRSLPCESAECVAVLPGDLILCFQEGKEQALYFDARVLDAQRRRHDVRGCRCRFLVRYDHDHSEEIVPLRKVCRRPETDFRLQILHASRAAASADAQNVSPVEQKPQKAHKMMDVNTAEVTVVRNPDQGGPSDKPAAPLPAAPAGTHGDSVSDVQMGNVEVIPKVEAANEAHDDNMNVVA